MSRSPRDDAPLPPRRPRKDYLLAVGGIGLLAVVLALILQADEVSRPAVEATVTPGSSIPLAFSTLEAASTSTLRIPPTTTSISTVTPTANANSVQHHTVESGDTLSGIAETYDVSIEAIMSANSLSDPDQLQVDQVLIIPVLTAQAAETTAAVTQVTSPSQTDSTISPVETPFQFSPLEGDLTQSYTLTRAEANFVIHYQPDSFTAQHIDEIALFIDTSQAHINSALGVNFNEPFDIYLAGSLFEPPDQDLRGRAFSAQYTVFVLYDGSATQAERQYILTHELTHMIAWNTYGRPRSAMLSEGAAVYTGEEFLLEEPFIAIHDFCLAHHRANRLPSVASSNLQFLGHLFYLETYYASGCFTQFLMQEYGAQNFGALYSTLDYQGVYGKSLSELEQEWLATLDADQTALAFSVEQWSTAYGQVLDDYRLFLNNITTDTFDTEIYHELNRRRIDIMQEILD